MHFALMERSFRMRQVTLALILGLLGFGLFVTAVAMAAPSQPAAIPLAGDSPLYDDPISGTKTISPTTHPVASAIAEHFHVEYSEIARLHDEEGLGFGVIAHAYFIAEVSGYEPDELIREFQSGKGWGEIWGKIWREENLHPGLARHGMNLGSIMSSRNKKGDDWMPPGQLKKSQPESENWMPPGQLKKDEPDDGAFVPPGQLKKSDEGDDSGDDRGGPPSVPPGQAKDKGKNKNKNNK
jgi:hypothetical protein